MTFRVWFRPALKMFAYIMPVGTYIWPPTLTQAIGSNCPNIDDDTGSLGRPGVLERPPPGLLTDTRRYHNCPVTQNVSTCFNLRRAPSLLRALLSRASNPTAY